MSRGAASAYATGTSIGTVAVHPKLGFMTDSVVRHILAIDGKLVLSLGDRGVAVVDATTLGID